MTTVTNRTTEVINPQGVRTVTTKELITLDGISKSQFQKDGTLTAQIRQVVHVKSYYPAKRTSSDMQNNLFESKEFNFDEQEFESKSTRMAWINVPINSTEAEVKARLEKANAAGATIYQVLSSAPILDDNQKNGITRGLAQMETFANAQALRYPVGSDNAGKLILDKDGKVQYRRTFYWNTPMEDQDARGKVAPYITAELEAELAGAAVMSGQTV